MARKARAAKKVSEDEGSESEVTTAPAPTRRVSRKASVSQKNKSGASKTKSKSKKAKQDSEGEDSGVESDAYVNEDDDDDEEDVASLDSDALDDEDFDASTKKRKRVSGASKSSPVKKSRSSTKSAAKKKNRVPLDDDFEDELEEGQEVVGMVIQAPKTGRVPPGQISQNTFDFLKLLQDPDCNDRTWFKLHEPVFRQAEKEWKDFIDEFTPLLTEADEQIPVLPPNDVVHRIYRDIRFSNNKTPYKTNFSASFSRSGRKGIFAGYHVSIKPGGSMFHAGTWCPGKNEIQTIRNNLTRSSRRMRELISAPAFVELFGEPRPHPKGVRRNIFGMEDELKVAPKGIPKTHKDIDLLKCRSFAVSCRLTDKEVLDPNFKERVKQLVAVAQPFVHGLNDMMTIQPNDDESGTESGDEAAEDGGDD